MGILIACTSTVLDWKRLNGLTTNVVNISSFNVSPLSILLSPFCSCKKNRNVVGITSSVILPHRPFLLLLPLH